jgi:hypothetical protein
MNAFKPGRGRPKKYGRAARAVTVTLPEDVLERLTSVDADLGRAIVTLAERTRHRQSTQPQPPVEISTYGNHAIILVSPVKVFKQLPDVHLVPIGNGRALISLGGSRSIAQLELDIRDAVERRPIDAREFQALDQVLAILQQARRSREVSLQQRTIIVLEPKSRRKTSKGRSVRL